MINHKFKIIWFSCKWTFHTSTRYETSLLFFYHYSFVFIQPLSAFILAIKRLPSHIASISVYIYPTIIKVFLNKYNKNFSCDLTWSIMKKCIMKKYWTCSAAALDLTLASCFIRQFMRLIVHFYSELTSNHHRVFVITSFCDHMWNLVVYCC